MTKEDLSFNKLKSGLSAALGIDIPAEVIRLLATYPENNPLNRIVKKIIEALAAFGMAGIEVQEIGEPSRRLYNVSVNFKNGDSMSCETYQQEMSKHLLELGYKLTLWPYDLGLIEGFYRAKLPIVTAAVLLLETKASHGEFEDIKKIEYDATKLRT